MLQKKRNFRGVMLALFMRRQESIFRGVLERRDFLLWQLYACILCKYISRFSLEALSFPLALYPLPSCRGVFHVRDEVELLTKFTPKQLW